MLGKILVEVLAIVLIGLFVRMLVKMFPKVLKQYLIYQICVNRAILLNIFDLI